MIECTVLIYTSPISCVVSSVTLYSLCHIIHLPWSPWSLPSGGGGGGGVGGPCGVGDISQQKLFPTLRH